MLRYGAYGPEVLDPAALDGDVLGPLLQTAVAPRCAAGPVDVTGILTQMLQMGDEAHNRNRAGTLMLLRDLAPAMVDSGADAGFSGPTSPRRCASSAATTTSSSTSRCPRASSRSTPPATSRARRWSWRWPATAPTSGSRSPAPATSGSPARRRWPRASTSATTARTTPTPTSATPRSPRPPASAASRWRPPRRSCASSAAAVPDALATTRRMHEITLAENPRWTGAGAGVPGRPERHRRHPVCRTGILPQINTGMAGRQAGVGQVGAGLVTPPAEIFPKALAALAGAPGGAEPRRVRGPRSRSPERGLDVDVAGGPQRRALLQVALPRLVVVARRQRPVGAHHPPPRHRAAVRRQDRADLAGPPPPSTAPTTSAMAPYVVTRPRGTRSTQDSTCSTYSSMSISPPPGHAERDAGHQGGRERGGQPGDPDPGRLRLPAQRGRERPDGRAVAQHREPAQRPQPHQATVHGRSPGPYDASTAATCATTRPAAASTACGCRPSRNARPHQATTTSMAAVPSGESGIAANPTASASTSATSQPPAARPEPGRAAPAGRAQQDQHAQDRLAGVSRSLIGPAPGAAGHGRASRRSTSSMVPGPPRDHRAAQHGQPAEDLLALDLAHPPGQVGQDRVGPVRDGRLRRPGERVDHEHREPAAHERGRGRADRLGQHRREHDDDRASGGAELQGLGSSARGSPTRSPADRAEQPAQVPAPGAVPDLLAPAPTTRSATRSPPRAWCSAIAAAARTVRSRLLALPSVPPDRPWSASASTTRRTPVSSSAARRLHVQRVGAQGDPPVDPPQPVPRLERPDPGELGAGAHPARPVRPDQPERLRRLGPGVERRGQREHPHLLAEQRHRSPPVAGPGAVRPTFSSPSIRRPQRRGLTSSSGGPSAEEPGPAPVPRMQRDVRRRRRPPG